MSSRSPSPGNKRNSRYGKGGERGGGDRGGGGGGRRGRSRSGEDPACGGGGRRREGCGYHVFFIIESCSSQQIG